MLLEVIVQDSTFITVALSVFSFLFLSSVAMIRWIFKTTVRDIKDVVNEHIVAIHSLNEGLNKTNTNLELISQTSTRLERIVNDMGIDVAKHETAIEILKVTKSDKRKIKG